VSSASTVHPEPKASEAKNEAEKELLGPPIGTQPTTSEIMSDDEESKNRLIDAPLTEEMRTLFQNGDCPDVAHNPFLQQDIPCCCSWKYLSDVPCKLVCFPYETGKCVACRPLLSLLQLTIWCMVWGVLFIMLGSIITVADNGVVHQEFRYDNQCTINSTCTVQGTVKKTMKAPIYVYYRISKFYQMHREYLQSKDPLQLNGDSIPSPETCVGADKDENGNVYYPCGLMANSKFNDTIYLSLDGGSTTLSGTNWDKSNIAWSTDKDVFKTRALETYETSAGAFDYTVGAVNDPDFIVWMRPAATLNLRKLYRKIGSQDLTAGTTLTFTFQNNYEVSAFGAEKHVILTQLSSFGSHSDFLGASFLAFGCLFVVLGAALQGAFMFMPQFKRSFGNMKEYLDRKKKASKKYKKKS